VWGRWQREFEETRRQSDRRHEDRILKFEDDQAERRERHAEFLAEQKRRFDAEAKEQKRRFDAIDAAMENDKRVTREMILELREGRDRDRDLRDEMRAQREGLLRMLDEMRRDERAQPGGRLAPTARRTARSRRASPRRCPPRSG
jgi:hypothetical protein